jgi:hypothetical protein
MGLTPFFSPADTVPAPNDMARKVTGKAVILP